MKKTYGLTLAGLLAALTLAVCVNTKNNAPLFLNAVDTNYEVLFNASKNGLTESLTLTSGQTNAYTAAGATLTLDYKNVKDADGAWAHLENGEVSNITAINDLKTLTIELGAGSLKVLSGTVNNGVIMYTESVEVNESTTITFNDGTSHFKLVSDNAVISSLSLSYLCNSGVVTTSDTLNFKGDGSLNYPYEISSLEEFYKLSDISQTYDFLGKNIKLTANLGTIQNNKKLGRGDKPFAGTFDGAGHTIDLNYNFDAGSANQGFVGIMASTGVVKNLTLTGQVTSLNTGDAKIGAFVGVLRGGKLINCTNKANVTAKGNVFGGLVGLIADNAGAELIDCVNDGVISSNGTSAGHITAGGLVGYANINSTISGCTNNGNVTVTGHQTGGIVGKITAGKITNSVNNGAVTSTATALKVDGGLGGIAGSIKEGNASQTITGCTNNGNVTAFDRVGGIVGFQQGLSTSSILTISNNTNLGTISSKRTDSLGVVGGITGYLRYGKILGSTNGVSTDSSKGTILNASTGKTTEDHGTGGIVGLSVDSGGNVIENCTNYADIDLKNTSMVGGISGKAFKTTFIGCKNYGVIKGYKYVSGICARGSGTVTNCVSNGDLHAYMANSISSKVIGAYWGDMTRTDNVTGEGNSTTANITEG